MLGCKLEKDFIYVSVKGFELCHHSTQQPPISFTALHRANPITWFHYVHSFRKSLIVVFEIAFIFVSSSSTASICCAMEWARRSGSFCSPEGNYEISFNSKSTSDEFIALDVLKRHNQVRWMEHETQLRMSFHITDPDILLCTNKLTILAISVDSALRKKGKTRRY